MDSIDRLIEKLKADKAKKIEKAKNAIISIGDDTLFEATVFLEKERKILAEKNFSLQGKIKVLTQENKELKKPCFCPFCGGKIERR